jgi:two-component system sensor histidine kinase PrrB
VKLSTRFAWMSAGMLPVLVVAAGLALVPWETSDLRTERDAHLQARAQLLVPQAAALVARGEDPASQISVALQAPDDSVVMAAHGADLKVGSVPRLSLLPAQDGPFSVRDGIRLWRGYADSDTAAGARVWVLEPDSVLAGKVRQLRGRVWFMALFAAPVAFGVGALLGRRTIRPLRVLRDRAARVGTAPGGRIGLRTGVEEVDEVARVLDAALTRRDEQEARTVEAWHAARSFAATAAHELRTPLSGIQAALDVLEHPGASGEDRGEALADLRESHVRVLGLLEVLRALSRAELAQAEAFAPVDLTELTEAALHAAKGRHPGTRFDAVGTVGEGATTVAVGGVPIGGATVNGPVMSGAVMNGPVMSGAVVNHAANGAVVAGWAEGLRMVVDNLLDNAALHGRPAAGPGHVALGLWRGPGVITLTVDDTGPGIPPDQRPRVFDRFRKSPASRGFGLGLTIVAQVVGLHRGTITVLDGPHGRGTRFEVRLPSAAPAGRSQGFPKEPA